MTTVSTKQREALRQLFRAYEEASRELETAEENLRTAKERVDELLSVAKQTPKNGTEPHGLSIEELLKLGLREGKQPFQIAVYLHHRFGEEIKGPTVMNDLGLTGVARKVFYASCGRLSERGVIEKGEIGYFATIPPEKCEEVTMPPDE